MIAQLFGRFRHPLLLSHQEPAIRPGDDGALGLAPLTGEHVELQDSHHELGPRVLFWARARRWLVVVRLRIVIAGWGLVLVRWGSAYAWGCHVAEIELDPATHQVRPLRLTAFVEILERPHSHGPYGAKGVGELPMDGPAPALVHALRAQGFDLRRIPATPERLLKLL